MKKSFIGASKVTFFGYEVTHGQWKLSQSRKDSIQAMPFPKSKKEMQSFLGAALFFHNHIPDYSEWSAKLYETTHDKFSWDTSKWTFDYESYFNRFKDCIQKATELYFPRYDLPWVVRCDASEYAVGAILFTLPRTAPSLTNPLPSVPSVSRSLPRSGTLISVKPLRFTTRCTRFLGTSAASNSW